MTTNRSQGSATVITVDCPWCDRPAEMVEAELHCPECAVTVQVAADVREPAFAVAA